MATTREIVERAYRKIAVVAEDEPMTADQAAAGLVALNSMLHSFVGMGVDLEHEDVVLAAEFPLAARHHDAVVYLLAERLGPDNLRPSPDADRLRRQLQAAFMTIETATFPIGMVYSPSRNRKWSL